MRLTGGASSLHALHPSRRRRWIRPLHLRLRLLFRSFVRPTVHWLSVLCPRSPSQAAGLLRRAVPIRLREAELPARVAAVRPPEEAREPGAAVRQRGAVQEPVAAVRLRAAALRGLLPAVRPRRELLRGPLLQPVPRPLQGDWLRSPLRRRSSVRCPARVRLRALGRRSRREAPPGPARQAATDRARPWRETGGSGWWWGRSSVAGNKRYGQSPPGNTANDKLAVMGSRAPAMRVPRAGNSAGPGKRGACSS